MSNARSTKKRGLFLTNHQRAFRDAASQLLKTPLSTLMTATVMALTLLFTSMLLTGLNAFQNGVQKINQNHQVTVYLKSDTEEAAIRPWLESLQNHPAIKEISYISPDEALKELTAQPDYQGILTGMKDNPLPPVVLVKFAIDDPQKIEALTTEFRKTPWVDVLQFNYLWYKRMFALLTLGHRIIYTLALLFGFGVMLMVSHVIQAATQKNHREMALLQLLGASRAYIRRPFLYLGTFVGLSAGLILTLLIAGLLVSINYPLKELLHSYNLSYSLTHLTLRLSFWGTLCSCLLGWMGAWLAFYKYSKHL